ncbi:MAG: hypothetical protein QMD65_03740 [Patescibacteria group bacterium]|nr:hypothetical protein [Patescibacteria group bacterium]
MLKEVQIVNLIKERNMPRVYDGPKTECTYCKYLFFKEDIILVDKEGKRVICGPNTDLFCDAILLNSWDEKDFEQRMFFPDMLNLSD